MDFGKISRRQVNRRNKVLSTVDPRPSPFKLNKSTANRTNEVWALLHWVMASFVHNAMIGVMWRVARISLPQLRLGLNFTGVYRHRWYRHTRAKRTASWVCLRLTQAGPILTLYQASHLSLKSLNFVVLRLNVFKKDNLPLNFLKFTSVKIENLKPLKLMCSNPVTTYK